MKFNNYLWNNYLQTKEGKNAITDFSFDEKEPSELDVTFRYNKQLKALFGTKKRMEVVTYVMDSFSNCLICNLIPPQTEQEAFAIYDYILEEGVNDTVQGRDYEMSLQTNTWISWLLYEFAPDFYFPNLFPLQFSILYKIADAYDIELPAIPKKADYKARCVYYWELCKVFRTFRVNNCLSPSELCAFLYDFAPNLILTEPSEMPEPSQAWFIGGRLQKGECNDVFWQANPETKRGDILVHYETAPASAITRIWRASSDGMTDPFFHFYGCVYTSNCIEITPVTLEELKADPYFSKHNLVRKNFQGVNGWPMSSEDYVRLMEILKSKEMDVGFLPRLYVPEIAVNEEIKFEEDVERILLEPLLDSMGFKKDKDYIRRLSVKAGRGHRIIADYALHYSNIHDEESAKVLIEAKFLISSNKEKEDAFKQARSYAYLLNSSFIILCDKVCIIVYQKRQSFDRNDYKKFYWAEMNNPDRFRELKSIIS